MADWEIEYTDEFGDWWDTLTEREQNAISMSVDLLASKGPQLERPHVDTLNGSQFGNMKELRTRLGPNHFRTFFAFDPRRCAILLIAGNKTGDDRFYETMIPIADRLYEQHLEEIEEEKNDRKK
ncbi:type II toxin-antitoxin system RelE/ParE family toxin [Crateriforma conspicua]|uniref:Addiction module toxin RelE n=1 Tax=Crateriforma conspicua TaxID=2527996 RepID=A0A5C6FD22_9PLAN|nr:type II toxin-antitoxin system RelE/ParE family toxin [Crateriforma conspicua]TWU59628.1 hypothetical protein V7x_55380 [Crateriforma conspicua]